MKLRSLILFAMTLAVVTGSHARGVEDESLGDKVKKFFAGPSPTPHKKHKTSTKKKTSPTPSPTPTVSASPSTTPISSPASTPSASASADETPPVSSAATTPMPTPTPATPRPATTPVPSAIASPSVYPAQSPRSRPHAPLIEPVRPISPSPRHRHVESPPAGVTIPTPPPISPRPTPIEIVSPPPAQASVPPDNATPTPMSSVSPTATPKVERKPTAPATISANEITGYENYPANMRKLLDLSLSLTTMDLGYKYGSADPKNGGMDCSGFINYILTQSGFKDVPRDAREQYIWVRKAGTFQAVLAHRDDSFELDALKPGDLLFWSGTYFVDRDPAITHTMIYLGRAKGTNQRLMVGSSDGRTYKGQSRFGVSVFDFKISPPKPKTDDKPTPAFVGYGRIPGFKDE